MNRIARRILEQGETAIPPAGSPALEQQVADAGAVASPVAPEVLRATLSTFDSRPVATREFQYAGEPITETPSEEVDVEWLSDAFTVPRGRVAVVRLVGYEIDPIPGINGAAAHFYRFTLLRNGEPVPYHRSIVLPPWSEGLETYVMADEGNTLQMSLTYLANELGSSSGTPSVVNFRMRGQLLLATGEPFEQLAASLPPPRRPAPAPERPSSPLPALLVRRPGGITGAAVRRPAAPQQPRLPVMRAAKR